MKQDINNNKWTTSTDGEIFTGEIYNTKEEAIEALEDDFDLENGHWIGQIESIPLSSLVIGDFIVEDIQTRAQDQAGESAEDYLNDVSKEEVAELEQVIVDWFEKKGYVPRFYAIKNSEQVLPKGKS